VSKARRAADLASVPRNPALLHASPVEPSSVCLPIPDRLLAGTRPICRYCPVSEKTAGLATPEAMALMAMVPGDEGSV
jgi:hypothetical protein